MDQCGAEARGAQRATTWISQGLEALVGEPECTEDGCAECLGDNSEFDIIIVGSGYGGAVAAAELSACTDERGRPLRICVLERGKEYLAGRFPSRQSGLPGHVRFATSGSTRQGGVFEGLYDLRLSEDVVAVLASGLGGGSLINAGVMEMPLPGVFRESRWPEAIRSDPDLAELAKKLREWLGAGEYAPADLSAPTKAEVLKVLAATGETVRAVSIQVARQDGPNKAGVFLDKCNACGDCATGCNHNAKDSLDINLLRIARRNRATLVTGATVLRVAPVNGGSDGWNVLVNHTDRLLRDRQCPDGPFTLHAKQVVLAAGTFGSTEILMRSRDADIPAERLHLSGQLGRKFSANGDMIALAYDLNKEVNGVADEDSDPGGTGRNIGPTITAMIDLRDRPTEADRKRWPGAQWLSRLGRSVDRRVVAQRESVVIQDLAVPGPLARLFGECATTADVLNELAAGDFRSHGGAGPDDAAVDPEAIRRSLLVALISRDDAEGELIRPDRISDRADGLLTVRWPALRDDERFDRVLQEFADRLERAKIGGRLVNNIIWRPLSDKLESVFGSQRGPSVTVHPLGGCAMGETITEGVTDDCGRVFRRGTPRGKGVYKGLVVLDGSIVPTSLGINPALTIATLALRAVGKLKEEWGLNGRSLLDGDPPATAAKPVLRPRFASPAFPLRAKTEIELSEQLRGRLRLRGRGGRWCRYTAELTFASARTRVEDLVARDSTARVFNVPPSTDSEPAKGRLRILAGDSDAVSDDWRADQVLLEAEISGSVRVFGLERSSGIGRALRAGWAWIRNRGLRDITQNKIRRTLQKLRLAPPPVRHPQSWWRYPLDIFRLATRAGAVRLVEYDFTITDAKALPARFPLDPNWFEGRPIKGVKRLTYARFSSPYSQLMEVALTTFPRLAPRLPLRRFRPKLVLNQCYIARHKVPVFRVLRQQDGISALIDMASLGLYGLRVVLQTHALSLRKPDPPSQRTPQRFTGPLPGCPVPEIDWVMVDNPFGRPIRVRLARYRGSGADGSVPTRPVLLIHGYSAGGTIFAHPAVRGGLAETLCRSGRDVWVIDMRSSSALPTATMEWPFEVMAAYDIPDAIAHIRRATGCKKLDIVAHCMGAAMFSMAILGERNRFDRENRLSKFIGRVVLSQVGPAMILSPANIVRGYFMRLLGNLPIFAEYEFSPQGEISVAGQLLDRALAAGALPQHEYRRENPLCPPGKGTPWVGTRHRMDALYGQTFQLRNLSDEVLDKIDDFLGPLNVQTVAQAIHFTDSNTVTDAKGVNCYATTALVDKRLTMPIFSIHGEDNGLVDVATLALMRRLLKNSGVEYLNQTIGGRDGTKEAQTQQDIEKLIVDARLHLCQRSYMTWRIKGYGHLDCLIGRDAARISRVVACYLNSPDVLSP